jgi:hypothetical protein
MALRIRIFNWIFLLAVAGTLTTEVRQTRAQTLEEGWSSLEPRYRSVRLRVRGFLRGAETVDPSDRSQVEAIDVLAKSYTWPVFQRKLDMKAGGIQREYYAFEHDLDRILKAKDRDSFQPLVEVLRDKLRIHALEVIQLREARPIHKLYDARVLAKVAEFGQPALAGTLIAILQDPQQNDGVRYYALKAMGTLLAQEQLVQQGPVLSKEERAKCAEALVTFLEQRKGPGKNAAPEEIDGFRLLRREAIRALAKIHTTAINDKVRPALVLARFAGNDERIQPPPRIDERVEAAIGLARMEPGKDKQYQPDYAASQIAKCLGDFAHMAENERANGYARRHPWRIHAAMLKDALEALKTNIEKNDYVAKVADQGAQLLNKVIAVSAIDANEQTWWRSSQSDPPSKELFQGSAESTVKLAQSDDEGPEK